MSDWREIRAAIAAMGYELGPDTLAHTRALLVDEQQALADAALPPIEDMAYGDHERQCLDIYTPDAADGNVPVLVWVHGGGFLKEAKSDPTHPFNAHIGRFAARNDYVGVVINYRLAPESRWPSGPEDLALVVDWLQQNAPEYGGDPDRICLVGTSAGAAHIAGYLKHRPGEEGIRGAVLLSGLYGFTPVEDRDRQYFGDDPEGDAERMPADAVTNTDIPLFLAFAEFDLPRFQAETLGLLQAHLQRRGHIPRSTIAIGHNHYSIGYHLGGSDSRLSGEILAFVADSTAA